MKRKKRGKGTEREGHHESSSKEVKDIPVPLIEPP
jgi:hypothetical protein